MSAPSSTDLAWVAGIIEGEGPVRINAITRHNLGALILAVTSTDHDMLEPLQAWFGGGTRPATTCASCKPAWRWTCASNEAAAVLAAILPFCRVARIVAKIRLGLEFQEQKRSGGASRTPEYRAVQVAYHARMKSLNVRGVA